MKNVILFYSHNTSASYLSDEQFIIDESMTPNLCTADVIDQSERGVRRRRLEKELSGVEDRTRKCFQTVDGIQYWHFKHLEPRYDTPWEKGKQDDEDLRYWVELLNADVETRGETIDAVVFPIGLCLNLGPKQFQFMEDMKKRYPNIQVIVHGQYLGDYSINNADFRAAAWPRSEKAVVNGAFDPVQIKRDGNGDVIASNGQSYALRDCVDGVTTNLALGEKQGMSQQNFLREMLGMEPMPEQQRVL